MFQVDHVASKKWFPELLDHLMVVISYYYNMFFLFTQDVYIMQLTCVLLYWNVEMCIVYIFQLQRNFTDDRKWQWRRLWPVYRRNCWSLISESNINMYCVCLFLICSFDVHVEPPTNRHVINRFLVHLFVWIFLGIRSKLQLRMRETCMRCMECFWSHFIERGESLYTIRLTSHAVNQFYLLQM